MNIFSLALAIIAACIPGVIWFLFFSRKDAHPEPKRLIVYTFSAGVFISIAVLVFQYFFQFALPEMAQWTLISVVGLALIEEFFKFFAAYWAVRKDRAFDEPVDAMIYMIAAALGFATVENIFVIANSLWDITSSPVAMVFETTALRLIGATLLHTLSSAIIGYYWAKGCIRGKEKRFILWGILIGTAIHAAFNYLILTFQNKNLLIYPSIFLVVIVFFVLMEFDWLKTFRVDTREK